MQTAHVILGGGLAGLALAVELRRAGVTDDVVVLERRSGPVADRTWSTWLIGDEPLARLVTARWTAWEVRDRAGRQHVARGARVPYARLRSDDVGTHLLDAATRAGVTVQHGTRVLGVDDPGEGPLTVRTDAGEITAGAVYDALAMSGPLARQRARGAVELHQRFLGWDVEVERPVFDPGVATLMDFTASRADEARFVYVLPTSPTSALVEDTSLGGPPVPLASRRDALRAYLDARGAGAVAVRREERGDLLMTDGRFSTGTWPRLVPVGTAAGAVRPSSGYAFSRTLRHVRAVARAVAAGGPAPPPPGVPLLDAMDRVMLRVLRDDPGRAPEVFSRLVAGVPADAFARFMVDVPSRRDVARVVRAAPTAPFLRAARSVAAGDLTLEARDGAGTPELAPV